LKLSISAKLRRTISSHCCFENEPNSPPSNVMVSCSSGKSASAQSSISAVKIDLYLEAKFVRIAVCIFKERLALVAITSGENKIRWAVEEQGESQIQGIPRRWALEATAELSCSGKRMCHQRTLQILHQFEKVGFVKYHKIQLVHGKQIF